MNLIEELNLLILKQALDHFWEEVLKEPRLNHGNAVDRYGRIYVRIVANRFPKFEEWLQNNYHRFNGTPELLRKLENVQ